MPDVTTRKTRDAWSGHATRATDCLNDALTELQRAQQHLEKDFRGRLTAPIENLRKAGGTILATCMKIHELRSAALKALEERDS